MQELTLILLLLHHLLQTLTSKTLVSPIFTGDLQGVNLTFSGNIQVDGNSTLGSDNNDTLTVAAVSTFNANTTLNNPVTVNAATTTTDDVQINQTSGTGSYRKLKFFDTSQEHQRRITSRRLSSHYRLSVKVP